MAIKKIWKLCQKLLKRLNPKIWIFQEAIHEEKMINKCRYREKIQLMSDQIHIEI